jgi:hypothetical protein
MRIFKKLFINLPLTPSEGGYLKEFFENSFYQSTIHLKNPDKKHLIISPAGGV